MAFRARLLPLLGLLGIAGVAASTLTPLPNLLTHWLAVPARLGPAHAIVVMGGAVYPDGLLKSSTLRRTIHGVVLYRRGLAPRLVLSGAGTSSAGREPRAALADALGVPREAMLVEAGARTTVEEARAVRELLGADQSILLVTDTQHMGRARRAFERAGFTVLPAPVEDVSPDAEAPADRLALMDWAIREIASRVLTRLVGEAR